MKTCPACYGPLMLLGQLGMRVHYRCRNCGLDCSHLKKARKPRAPKTPPLDATELPPNEEFSRNPVHRRGE